MIHYACVCGHESEDHFKWTGECLHEENDEFCDCLGFEEASE